MGKFFIILALCAIAILSGIFMLGLSVAWYDFSVLGIGLIVLGSALFIVFGIIALFYAVSNDKL